LLLIKANKTIEYMNSGDIKLIQLSSYIKPDIKEYYGRKWVLNGEKNYFPRYVIDRKIGSPTNGSIIEVFCELMYGRGIAVNGNDEIYEDLIEIFPKREIRKCLNDYQTFGYYFLQILRSKGSDKKVAKILHFPAEKMGRDKANENGEIDGAWYCEDWTNTNKYKPKFIKEFKGKLTDSVMVKSVVPHQQGQSYFALPNYIQGLQYAEMEEEISNYCINHIKNGLSFGYIINFNNGGNITPEQKDEIERQIKLKLTGSSNAGKFILSFNDNKDAEVTVVPLEVNDAHSQWEFLTKEARQQIITAHGAYPNLFGINSGNGFSNNADELDVQSKLVQDYQITPKQDFFLDELAGLLEINGLETDLKFIPLRDTYKSTETQLEDEPIDETIDDDIEPVEMSEDYNCENVDLANLISKGESIDFEQWELVDDTQCDDITLKEDHLNSVITLASQISGDARKTSEQDTSLFKIRYRYVGNPIPQRDFCRKLMQSNKVYRAEDIENAGSVNPGFGVGGSNTYNIFKYKGGVNCRHWWQRVIYLKKGSKQISVNQARKLILDLEPSERNKARWESNPKEVAQVASVSNNHWKVN